MKKKLIFIITISLLFSNLAFALTLEDVSSGISSIGEIFSNIFRRFFPFLTTATTITISCDNCVVGQCYCTISGCDSGILEVYQQSSCNGIPTYIYIFSFKKSGGTSDWLNHKR